MDDGYRLPVKQWGDPAESEVIILALHGLNDYSQGFDSTGNYLSRHKIALISYDQRGFGATAGHGYWHGSQRLIDDSLIMLRLLQEKFPGRPLFMLGESMGGAIVLAALHEQSHDMYKTVYGTILLAPAIWSRQSMPWYQRALLRLAAHVTPAKKLTGEGLNLTPSDNIEMLKAMGRDPLVIKATRVDVLYGVTNLMDQASAASTDFSRAALILYGKHDQIVPRKPTCQWLQTLPEKNPEKRKVIIYEKGYHMLNRDLQAKNVLDDMVSWLKSVAKNGMDDEPNPLNSKVKQGKQNSFSEFCKEIMASSR